VSLEGSSNPASGTRRVLATLAGLALLWGAVFHVRTVLAFGIAQALVLVLLALISRLSARGVRATRRMSARAFEDDEVEVSFGLENRGLLPLVFPEVEDCFTPDQELFRRAPLPFWVGRRTRAVGRYRGSCHGKRGDYTIGPARVRVADPLGLYPRDVILDERTQLIVYPRTVALAALPAGGRGLPLSASATSRSSGQSAEALSVREYRPGDPLRRIHWPTTARRGKLAVLELELEHARDVAIFLDLDRRTLRGLGRRSTLEYSVRIAASAAATYLRRGDRVRLYAHGAKPVFVPAGTGERHLALVLEALAHVKPDGDTTLEKLLETSAGELPPGGTAFVILPAADQEVAARTAAIAALRARGCHVVCVLLDERSFLAIWKEQHRPPAERVDLPRAADALLLEGAQVYVVSQGDDLARSFLAPYGASYGGAS
jgi:uncharacterized protein (DUF58 family)